MTHRFPVQSKARLPPAAPPPPAPGEGEQVPSLFMLTSKHFFSRQARHWFLCVLSTGQPPCNTASRRAGPGRGSTSALTPTSPRRGGPGPGDAVPCRAVLGCLAPRRGDRGRSGGSRAVPCPATGRAGPPSAPETATAAPPPRGAPVPCAPPRLPSPSSPAEPRVGGGRRRLRSSSPGRSGGGNEHRRSGKGQKAELPPPPPPGVPARPAGGGNGVGCPPTGCGLWLTEGVPLSFLASPRSLLAHPPPSPGRSGGLRPHGPWLGWGDVPGEGGLGVPSARPRPGTPLGREGEAAWQLDLTAAGVSVGGGGDTGPWGNGRVRGAGAAAGT